jgi:hypothetical protein
MVPFVRAIAFTTFNGSVAAVASASAVVGVAVKIRINGHVSV